MSLFVAIVPSASAVEDLAERVQAFRHAPVLSELHWQPPVRWHVTMAFLGDVGDDADAVVADLLDDVAGRCPRPSLRLAGSGVFGRQVLWAGVRGATDADDADFAALARLVQASLRGARFELERRAWRPHLTLARARGFDARPAGAFLDAYFGPPWEVDELLAVRSQGGPAPVHTVVHRRHIAAV